MRIMLCLCHKQMLWRENFLWTKSWIVENKKSVLMLRVFVKDLYDRDIQVTKLLVLSIKKWASPYREVRKQVLTHIKYCEWREKEDVRTQNRKRIWRINFSKNPPSSDCLSAHIQVGPASVDVMFLKMFDKTKQSDLYAKIAFFRVLIDWWNSFCFCYYWFNHF